MPAIWHWKFEEGKPPKAVIKIATTRMWRLGILFWDFHGKIELVSYAYVEEK